MMIRHLVCLCLSLLCAGTVSAHPHVWVDAQYQLTVDQLTISHVKASWELDLFTSTSLIMEYDVDGDGIFEGQERDVMLDTLRSFDKYGYFIKMAVDGNSTTPTKVDILDIGIRDQMLWMTLDIELPEPVNLETSTLSLAFGDDELYFAMVPVEEGLVKFSGALSESCTPVEREAEEVSVEIWMDVSCNL